MYLDKSYLFHLCFRCFTYCIQQNRGQAKQLEAELCKIVPHLYGKTTNL